MYVFKKKTSRKKIVELTENNVVSPTVTNVTKHLNEDGTSFQTIDASLEFNIDMLARKSNMSTLEEDKICEYVEIRLSKDSLKDLKRKSGKTLKKEIERANEEKFTSLSTAKRKNKNTPPIQKSNIPVLNKAIPKSGLFNNVNILKILENTFSVGRVTISKKLDTPNVKNKYILNSGSETTASLSLKNSVFKKTYLSLVESGKDPAVLFQDGFDNTELSDKLKGRFSKIKSNNEDFYYSSNSLLEGIFLSLGKNNTSFNVDKTVETERYKKYSIAAKISLEKLRTFGENIHVILLCKNKKGVIVETDGYFFSYESIMNQIKENALNYAVNAVRLGTGTSLLTVQGKEKNKDLEVVLHAKKIKRSLPFERGFYLQYQNLVVKDLNVQKIFDGELGRQKNSTKNFKPSEGVFYRTTINYKGKSYDNLKSAFDTGRAKQENIPSCSVTVLPEISRNGVTISITNISENVVAVKPVKYSVIEKIGLLKYLEKDIYVDGDSGPKPLNGYIDARGTSSEITLIDLNVSRDKYYFYGVECVMKNGEIKMSSAYFVYSHKRREGTLKIRDINYLTNSSSLSSDEIESDTFVLTKPVTISFKVEKIETEIDKILKNMFGDLYDIFSDNLKDIKDVQGLAYSVEIIRVDKDTGENETIGKVSPDKEGNCEFIDENCPALNNVTYILNPRVSLMSDLIDDIDEKIKNLGARTVGRTLNFVNASNKATQRQNRNRIFTSVNKKYSRRPSFLKGLIETPEKSLDRSRLDIFLDTATGDVELVNIQGTNILTDKKVSVFDVSFSRINNIKRSKREKIHYSLDFKFDGNDYFIDFFGMFIKNGNEVYLDGVMHSKDNLNTYSDYSYLVSHNPDMIGLVEYYIVPFYKDGTVGSPKIVHLQNFD